MRRGGRAAKIGLKGPLVALGLPIIVGLFLLHAAVVPVEWSRNALFDLYQRVAPRAWSPDLPVRVIDIDDASLARLGQWPWPRSRLADLVDKLKTLGASAIAFDMIFAEADRLSAQRVLDALPDFPEKAAAERALLSNPSDGDDRLASAVASGSVALGFVLGAGVEHSVPAKWGFAAAGDDPQQFLPPFANVLLPLPDLARAAPALGSLNFVPDRDLIVRKMPVLLALEGGVDGEVVPTLSAEALRLQQHASTYVVRSTNASRATAFRASTGIISVRIGDLRLLTEADGGLRIRFAGHQPGRTIPAWKALAGSLKPDDVRGRIVLIGSSAAGLGDIRSTPLDAATPGVEIHAEALESVFSGARLLRPDFALGVETFALLLGGIATGLLGLRAAPATSTPIVFALAAAAFAASWQAFLHAGLLFDPILPVGTWIAAWGAGAILAFRRAENERRQVRDAFSRYVAPAVVESLAADPSRVKLGGEARQISVLFCDLRGFTARAERMSAEAVVSFLNAVHTPLTRIVLETGGTVDKYLGDGLMAFWNAPLDVPNHAACACRAAAAMRNALPEIERGANDEAILRGGAPAPVRFAMGLTTGEAFVGNMGSELRFDYSIVGDPVNTAARLEAACDDIGAEIVVSEEAARASPDFLFVDLGAVPLKGKREPVRVFGLHDAAAARDAAYDAFAALHKQAIDAAAQGDADALGPLIASLEANPHGARYPGFYRRLMSEACARMKAGSP